MEDKIKMMTNGRSQYPYRIYMCEKCKKEIGESSPREEILGKIYCGDCAFLFGKITEKQYIENHLFFICLDGIHAAVRDGKIYLTRSKYFPWERKDNSRSYPEYIEWRERVFGRDKHTCQSCGKVGGTLNAHHIKSFAKYPKLRTELSNGITLCKKCHDALHRGEDNDGSIQSSINEFLDRQQSD